MSIALMTQVWRMDLATTDKMVLLALADAANDDGVCWTAVKARTPGKLDLITKCSLSERAIQGAIKRLCEAGFLGRIERPGRGVIYTVSTTPDPRTSCAPQELRPAGNDTNPRSSCGETISNPNPKTKSVARAFPSDWALSQSDRDYALSQGLTQQEIERAVEDFTGHFIAAGNKRSTDWSLNWKRWCRTTADRKSGGFSGMAGRQASGGGGRQTADVAAEVLRRQREREQGVAVPGGQTGLSGGDHGWADGAVDGELSRRTG